MIYLRPISANQYQSRMSQTSMNMQMTPDAKPNTAMPPRPGKMLRKPRAMTKTQKRSVTPTAKKLQFGDINIVPYSLSNAVIDLKITNTDTTSPVGEGAICPICCVKDPHGPNCEVCEVCHVCFYPSKTVLATLVGDEGGGVVWCGM